ncbi:hypothetical protein P879_06574 [Paragonimus westermani]|uniref:C2H2-type domain-containing protein n=1 Tax=Paragonimus westermani TaxID=34504 RepID=A0A8T0D6U1_9TREM|nr:hypothetical protein P879_06574 [Paragonimus westermani]
MTPASVMGAAEETPDMTFNEMTQSRYARAVSTPRRQLRSELWHLHGHTLLFDKHTSPLPAQTSQIMLPSTERPNQHIPHTQVPFTVFDELSDEVLERGGGGTGDAGTFTSSTPPQTASFSPPSEFSGHSLVHDMKSLDTYPECMFALDLRVPTKRCPEEAIRNPSEASPSCMNSFNIQSLLEKSKHLDQKSIVSSQNECSITSGLSTFTNGSGGGPANLLLQAISTLFHLNCQLPTHPVIPQRLGHVTQCSQPNPLSCSIPNYAIHDLCLQGTSEHSHVNVACTLSMSQTKSLGTDRCKSCEVSDHQIVVGSGPSTDEHVLFNCELRKPSPNLSLHKSVLDDDGDNKGPVLFYFPEPNDSKAQIRNMIKRNDPRLKYVNDGAAIRNPFVVDRKVQLAHLTTLLLVRPYVCPECGRSFSQRCSLEGHRRKIHKIPLTYCRNQRRDVMRVCETCGFACPNVSDMLSHMMREHPNWSGLPRLRRQLLRQEERRRRFGEQTNSSGLQSTPSHTSRANARLESSLTSLDGVGTTLSVEPSGRADSPFPDLNGSKEVAKQFEVSANNRIVPSLRLRLDDSWPHTLHIPTSTVNTSAIFTPERLIGFPITVGVEACLQPPGMPVSLLNVTSVY